jgi:hypothetical protein
MFAFVLFDCFRDISNTMNNLLNGKNGYAMTAIFLFYVNNVFSYQAHFGEIKKKRMIFPQGIHSFGVI